MRREAGELRIDLPSAGLSGEGRWLVAFTVIWFVALLAYYLVLVTLPDGAQLWSDMEAQRDERGLGAELPAPPAEPVQLVEEESERERALEFSERAELLEPYYVFFWYLPLVALIPGVVLLLLALRSCTSRSTLHASPGQLRIESTVAGLRKRERTLPAEEVVRIEIEHDGALRIHRSNGEMLRVAGRTLRKKPKQPIEPEQLPPCGRIAAKAPLDAKTCERLWRWEPAHAITTALRAMYAVRRRGEGGT